MISFFITTRCNLDCIYCYTNKGTVKHQHQTLDWEFAKLGIDDYYTTQYKRHIRFFGAGEPTEEIDLIEQIYRYAKKKDKATTSEIQTNGCFSVEVADWLAQNVDIIWISCDGPPKIQDEYRPMLSGESSSEKIDENIQRMMPQKHTGIIGIRATITNRNYDKQIELIDHYSRLGIKNFWVDPIFPSIGEKVPVGGNLDMGRFTKHFIQAVKYAYDNGLTYGSILTCNFDEPGEYACRALLPVPHLTSDGYVSACDMALFGEDANHMDIFMYGKWDKANHCIIYDEKKIRTLRSRSLAKILQLSDSPCAHCSVAPFCRGYCPGEVVNETYDLFGCKKTVCKPVVNIFDSLSDREKSYIFSHP